MGERSREMHFGKMSETRFFSTREVGVKRREVGSSSLECWPCPIVVVLLCLTILRVYSPTWYVPSSLRCGPVRVSWSLPPPIFAAARNSLSTSRVLGKLTPRRSVLSCRWPPPLRRHPRPPVRPRTGTSSRRSSQRPSLNSASPSTRAESPSLRSKSQATRAASARRSTSPCVSLVFSPLLAPSLVRSARFADLSLPRRADLDRPTRNLPEMPPP